MHGEWTKVIGKRQPLGGLPEIKVGPGYCPRRKPAIDAMNAHSDKVKVKMRQRSLRPITDGDLEVFPIDMKAATTCSATAWGSFASNRFGAKTRMKCLSRMRGPRFSREPGRFQRSAKPCVGRLSAELRSDVHT